MGECASVEAEHLVPLAAARPPNDAPRLGCGGTRELDRDHVPCAQRAWPGGAFSNQKSLSSGSLIQMALAL